MTTKIIKDPYLAGRCLKNGNIAAIPTETVYGLAADALNREAVLKIFEIKGRPSDNPLIVHIASFEDIYKLVSFVPKEAEILAESFWPGPFTMILPKSKLVPDIITANLETIALRSPGHNAAIEVIKASGVPLAAPSANPSGRPSPTSAEHVFADLNGKIEYILDGGQCSVGVESTVYDVLGKAVLRPGMISREQIKAVLGFLPEINFSSKASPGLKHRHYSPKTPVKLFKGTEDLTNAGMLCYDGEERLFDNAKAVISLGKEKDYDTQAKRLFWALREMDNLNVDVIYTRLPENDALADRLRRAAIG